MPRVDTLGLARKSHADDMMASGRREERFLTTEGVLAQPQAEAQRPAPSDDKKTGEQEQATKASALGQRGQQLLQSISGLTAVSPLSKFVQKPSAW